MLYLVFSIVVAFLMGIGVIVVRMKAQQYPVNENLPKYANKISIAFKSWLSSFSWNSVVVKISILGSFYIVPILYHFYRHK